MCCQLVSINFKAFPWSWLVNFFGGGVYWTSLFHACVIHCLKWTWLFLYFGSILFYNIDATVEFYKSLIFWATGLVMCQPDIYLKENCSVKLAFSPWHPAAFLLEWLLCVHDRMLLRAGFWIENVDHVVGVWSLLHRRE